MKLAELQSEFAEAVLRAGGPVPVWVSDARAGQGFDVYRNNVATNYRAALRAVFAVVALLVGDAYFDAVSDRYALAHPSTSGDIHGFGGRFPEFLAGQAGLETLPYLSDVARLEWLMHESFHAADRDPLDPARLASVNPASYGGLRFELHPAVRFHRAAHPAKRIWEIHQPAFEGAFEVDLDAGAESLLIARRLGFTIEIERLEDGEHALLSSFSAGAALSDAAAAALAADSGFDFASSLAKRVADRTLVDFRL